MDKKEKNVRLRTDDFENMKKYALLRAKEIMDNANYPQGFKITIEFPNEATQPTIEYNVLEAVVPLDIHEKYGAGAK